MEVQVCLCCLESFPAHLNPLEVLVLKSQLDSVFRGDTDSPTLLFSPQRHSGSSKPGILLRVHPATEDETAGSPRTDTESRVKLFASRFFLRHYGLQRLSGGTVRPLRPVCLDRVVLGARSRQNLRRAGAERFTAALLALCGPGQTLLAREGDPLLLPQEDPVQVRGVTVPTFNTAFHPPVIQGLIGKF